MRPVTASHFAKSQQGQIVMRVREILETCLYVNDLAQAERFYREVLGLQRVTWQPGRHVFFRCGRQMLLLFDPAASSAKDSELPPHGTTGHGHVAFAVAQDEIANWLVHLQDCHIPVEKMVRWPGGGQSIYFRDPSNNSLEVTTPRIWGLEESWLDLA
jgi:catechol 2,3-dioxygenase-like lactoylglutathione lyase family enzyme